MSRVLVPIILFLSSIGLFFSYIRPTYDSLQLHKNLEQRLLQARTTIGEFETKKSLLTEQYSTMRQTDLDRLKMMLPENIDPVRVIIDIDNAARMYNLTIDSFTLPNKEETVSTYENPELMVPTVGYTSSTFMITLAGRYEDFKAFLTRIESDLMLIDVTQLGIDAESGKESETLDPGEYMYEIAFKTYTLQ